MKDEELHEIRERAEEACTYKTLDADKAFDFFYYDVPKLLAEVERLQGLIGKLDSLFDLSEGFISGETDEIFFEDAGAINEVFAELKEVTRND